MIKTFPELDFVTKEAVTGGSATELGGCGWMRPGKSGLFKYLRARLLLLSRDQPGSMAGREHLWEWGGDSH